LNEIKEQNKERRKKKHVCNPGIVIVVLLRSDLFRSNLIENPICSCGAGPETAEHYISYCTKYVTARNKLKNNIELINIPFVLTSTLNPHVFQIFILITNKLQFSILFLFKQH
jgi:hypothetical protein